MKKRLIALALALCMLAGLLPSVYAAAPGEADEWIVGAEEVQGVSRAKGDGAGREAPAEPLYNDDEIVTVMVHVEGPSLMDWYDGTAPVSDRESSGAAAASFISNMVENDWPEALIEEYQTPVIEAIAALGRRSEYSLLRPVTESVLPEIVGQWITLVNAFAVRVPYGQLAEIQRMDGVRNAYVQKTYSLPEEVENPLPDAGL